MNNFVLIKFYLVFNYDVQKIGICKLILGIDDVYANTNILFYCNSFNYTNMFALCKGKKKFFKENSNPLRLLSNVPIPKDYDRPKLKELVTIKKVTEQEYEKNPRSRSAKLRVAERI